MGWSCSKQNKWQDEGGAWYDNDIMIRGGLTTIYVAQLMRGAYINV